MENPPQEVPCPDDPPKRFADLSNVGSTTWELPSSTAPEQEPPKDHIPEPELQPNLPEEPKGVEEEQKEEVERKVDGVEGGKDDLFHTKEQVTRAEQMEKRNEADMEVKDGEDEDEKPGKKRKPGMKKPASAKAKAKAKAKALAKSKAKVSEKVAAKAEAKAKAKAAPRKRKETSSNSKPKKVKPALPGVPGDGEQPALPGGGEQPAVPGGDRGDGEQPALPAAVPGEQPPLQPGDGEQPVLPDGGEQPALPGGEQPASRGGDGDRRKRQQPPLEVQQPSKKKTFAGRNRPSTKIPSERFDSIRDIFETHVKDLIRAPTSLEAWITYHCFVWNFDSNTQHKNQTQNRTIISRCFVKHVLLSYKGQWPKQVIPCQVPFWNHCVTCQKNAGVVTNFTFFFEGCVQSFLDSDLAKSTLTFFRRMCMFFGFVLGPGHPKTTTKRLTVLSC